jgi:hypothetical protein
LAREKEVGSKELDDFILHKNYWTIQYQKLLDLGAV